MIIACTEFPSEPPGRVSIAQATSWPSELFVTDTQTLIVAVKLPDSTAVTGLRVKWQSSNDAILTVTPSPANSLRLEDTLTAQLRALVTARAGGFDTVRVEVEGGGAFQPLTVSYPIRVMQKWVAVSAGYEHSCGVTVDGNAYCWGTGLLGNGSTAGSRIPVQVLGQVNVKSVAAGNGHSCLTLVDGRAYCWGLNVSGAIGNGLPDDQLTPVPVSLGHLFQSVDAGQDYACGLTTEATGFCWGDNTAWQLGDGGLVGVRPKPPFDECGFLAPNICSLRPRPIQNRSRLALPLIAVGPRAMHTCAVLTSRAVVCWGHGSKQLGSDVVVTTDTTAPLVEPVVVVPGGLMFSSVTVGRFHSCGITYPQRQISCWGFNSHGELGGTSADTSRPVAVSGPARTYVSVRAGENSTCGISSDSTAYCWGSNEFGQLGTTGTTGTCSGVNCSRSPLQLQLPNDLNLVAKVIAVSIGVRHGCAVIARGAAYCWGEASGGKLGNDTVSNAPILVNPVRVSEPL